VRAAFFPKRRGGRERKKEKKWSTRVKNLYDIHCKMGRGKTGRRHERYRNRGRIDKLVNPHKW
jgi:hypothetical protein